MRYLRFALAGLLLASPLFAGSAALSQLDPLLGAYSTGGFSVCASGTRSFKVSYSYGYDPAYGIGPNPYRMTVRLFKNGSQIASTTYQWASAWTNQYFSNVDVSPGTYTATVQLEERTFHGFSIGWTTLETVSANSVVASAIAATPAFDVDGVAATGNGPPIDVCASRITVNAAATTCETNYWVGVHEMDRWNWTGKYGWGIWTAGQAPNGISLQQLATNPAGYSAFQGLASRKGEALFGGYLDPPGNTVERYYWLEVCTAEPSWQCQFAVIKVNGDC